MNGTDKDSICCRIHGMLRTNQKEKGREICLVQVSENPGGGKLMTQGSSPSCNPSHTAPSLFYPALRSTFEMSTEETTGPGMKVCRGGQWGGVEGHLCLEDHLGHLYVPPGPSGDPLFLKPLPPQGPTSKFPGVPQSGDSFPVP